MNGAGPPQATNCDRQRWREDLHRFLRTLQKPGKSLAQLGDDEGLVASGLIDSLALVQIVVYLEDTYGIDFGSDIGYSGNIYGNPRTFGLQMAYNFKAS